MNHIFLNFKILLFLFHTIFLYHTVCILHTQLTGLAQVYATLLLIFEEDEYKPPVKISLLEGRIYLQCLSVLVYGFRKIA